MAENKQTYSDKLKDPRWQKKRLEIYERDNWSCQNCYDTESTLVVHHRRYIPGREPWDYPNNLLVTLCQECHEKERELMPEAEGSLLEQIRDKFLSSSVFELATGINQLELHHAPEIVASVYSWAFSNSNIQDELIEKYFAHLKEEARLKNAK